MFYHTPFELILEIVRTFLCDISKDFQTRLGNVM